MLKDNKELIKNLFSVKNIIIYVLAFMVSMVGMGQDVSPFSIAMVGACLASKIPAIVVLIVGLIGNIVGVGTIGALNYILIILMLLITMCIKPPKENDEYKDEQMQISKHIFFSIILFIYTNYIYFLTHPLNCIASTTRFIATIHAAIRSETCFFCDNV